MGLGERMPRASASRGEQGRHGQGRAVEPESLEAVIQPLLAMEDMHDEVAEIEEDPAAGVVPLAPMGLGACLEEHVLDLVRDGDDIPLGGAGDDEEHVGEGQGSGHVEGDEILAALRIGRARREGE